MEEIKKTPQPKFKLEFKEVLEKLIDIFEGRTTNAIPKNSIYHIFLKEDKKINSYEIEFNFIF